MRKRVIGHSVVGLFAAAGILLGAAGVSSASSVTVHGCPSGAVCIYPQDAGWNGDHPSDVYFSYGAHNLVNQNGMHYILNNQTGGATMRTCTGYNGTGCEGYLPQDWSINKDLTPINSITLEP
jgi:hypothetical protein